MSAKTSKDKVRIGIIGIGGMGGHHAQDILKGAVPRAELVAACDLSTEALKKYPDQKHFTDYKEMYRSGVIDAVIIATPHYFHTQASIDALQSGIHVLVEKPLAVHKQDCEKMIAAHTDQKLVFAAMFQQRTEPCYQKIRSLLKQGELGQIRRIHWTATNWFRPNAYYASAGWRATWKGEGGGVLINQCPHNLDLFQWLFGMPLKVRAHCQIGRYHPIEVEDDVTAYFEYADGTTGVFVASTGESPGVNRVEVIGDMGRLTFEANELRFQRNEISASEFCKTTTQKFGKPSTWNVTIPIQGSGGKHAGIMNNFTDAILDGASLIAPAVEGIHSVELINAMLYSSFNEQTVVLPMDGATYTEFLNHRIAESEAKKTQKNGGGRTFSTPGSTALAN
jgi:predicted dehydrogenase